MKVRFLKLARLEVDDAVAWYDFSMISTAPSEELQRFRFHVLR